MGAITKRSGAKGLRQVRRAADQAVQETPGIVPQDRGTAGGASGTLGSPNDDGCGATMSGERGLVELHQPLQPRRRSKGPSHGRIRRKSIATSLSHHTTGSYAVRSVLARV